MAFNEAQSNAAVRTRLGRNWPLREFWKDRVIEHKKKVNEFVDPILKEAVERQRNEERVPLKGGEREAKEGESLLDHLLHYTNGWFLLSSNFWPVDSEPHDARFPLPYRPDDPQRRDVQYILSRKRYSKSFTPTSILEDHLLIPFIQTASLITFAMYMLAEHPDVLNKLRTEILGKVGTNGLPTYSDMKEMKYLRAVINGRRSMLPFSATVC